MSKLKNFLKNADFSGFIFYALPFIAFSFFVFSDIELFGLVGKAKFYIHTLVEIIFFYSAIFILSSFIKSKLLRNLFNTFTYISYVLVLLIQGLSVSYSGNFISVLALQNLTEGGHLDLDGKYLYIAINFAFLVAYIIYQFFKKKDHDSSSWKIRGLLLILCLAPLVNSIQYQIDSSNLKLQISNTPIFMFMNNALIVKKVQACRDYDIFCKSDDVESYKFSKKSLYTKEKKIDHSCLSGDEKPNVLIFFVEGFSIHLLNYGTERSGMLMPNLKRLTDESINFSNYRGHTAATYRGLKGQLSSGYSEIGGATDHGWSDESNSNSLKINRNKSLIDVLNSSGYKSKFYNSHPRGNSFNTLIDSLGFKKIATMDDLKDFPGVMHQYDPKNVGSWLIDRDFLTATSLDLGDLQKDSPFIAAFYNTGTHAFLDVSPGELKYGNGKNQVLNRFHNFDFWFGIFLERFKGSGLQKNTVLIVTADHATYPDKPYLEIFKGASSGYFIDKIPLIIKMPCGAKGSINAGGRNSLDLAPTIANILNLPDQENSFMGDSLFAKKNSLTSSNFGAYGYDYFLSTETGLYTRDGVPASLLNQFDILQKTVEDYYALERRNALVRNDRKH